MADRKRILVVGCGAIGGIVAAALSRVSDLVAYDNNAAHVSAIRERGLRVLGANESVARMTATADPKELTGGFDAIVLLIKSKATGAVIEQLRPLLDTRPLLVTLQNGMGNVEVLLEKTQCPVARGVTMHAGRYVEPGCVEHLISGGKTWIGPSRGSIDEIRWFGDLLNQASFATEVIPDPMAAIWSKLIFNSVLNPVGALLLGDNHARYASTDVQALIDDMAAEATKVVEALGGKLAFDPLDFVKKTRSGALPVGKHAGSMALDIARGAATEIDELTGYIVAQGERLGIPVPTCKTVYRLVKGLEIAAARRHGQPG